MTRTRAIALAIAALACGAQGSTASAATSRAAVSDCVDAGLIAASEVTRQKAIASLLCIVNLERANAGAGPLRASGLLAGAALAHSTAMVAGKFVSHTSANGDSVRRRALRAGYLRGRRTALVGETITWGSGVLSTPAQLVVGLMASPDHRRTMLDRRFRDVGVGMALGAPMADIGGQAATVTLNFGRR